MFGLFKKKATPGEFGHGVLHMAGDSISADAGRSLGTRFDDFDGTRGWENFLERKGVSIVAQKLYFRLYAHCAIQAASTRFEGDTRRMMTQGAMGGFKSQPEGYNFERTYTALEAAYRGQHTFDRRVELLGNSGAQLRFLPNPNAGVLNAKYLVESYVIPNMKNVDAFLDDFEGYSSTVFATVGTVHRAMDHLLGSFKIS